MSTALADAVAPVADSLVDNASLDAADTSADVNTDAVDAGADAAGDVETPAADDAAVVEDEGGGEGEGAAATETPADAVETPAKPGEEEAGEPATETAPAAEDPADKQFDESWGAFVGEYRQLEQKLDAGKLDPLDEKDMGGAMKTILKGMALLDAKIGRQESVTQRQRATAETERAWAKWSKETGIEVGRGQKLYAEQYAAALKEYGNDPRSAQVAATERFRVAVQSVVNGKKGRAAATAANNPPTVTTPPMPPKGPASPNGARVTPPAANNPVKPPPPKPESAAEKLFKKHGPLSKARL